MSKLVTLKQSGRLRLMTSLCPVKRNVTRWTGVQDMFQRFERLLPNLNLEDGGRNDELMDFVPSAAQNKNIRDHKQALADFKSVTIALRRHDMTIKESNVLFRSIIDAYKEFNFEGYLGAESDIIHSKPLESAILKIQSNKEDILTDVEKELWRNYWYLHCWRMRKLVWVQEKAVSMMLICLLLIEHSNGRGYKTRQKVASTSTRGFCFRLHAWLSASSRRQNACLALIGAG